jgi:hypothetical protein
VNIIKIIKKFVYERMDWACPGKRLRAANCVNVETYSAVSKSDNDKNAFTIDCAGNVRSLLTITAKSLNVVFEIAEEPLTCKAITSEIILHFSTAG